MLEEIDMLDAVHLGVHFVGELHLLMYIYVYIYRLSCLVRWQNYPKNNAEYAAKGRERRPLALQLTTHHRRAHAVESAHARTHLYRECV